MKKRLVLLLTSLVLCNACTFLDEEPQTKIPLEEYFNNKEEAVLFLYGTYYTVQSVVFGSDFMHLTDTMTDNVDYTSTTVARRQIATLTLNPTNSVVKSVWGKLYVVVEQCNILIDQLERLQAESIASDAGDYAAILREARFIRSWAYFQLVQLWGDVPLLTVPTYSIKEDNIRPSRTPRDEIYAFLIADLEAVSEDMPEQPQNISISASRIFPLTISKAAAKLLLAKIYLVRAGKGTTDNGSEDYMNVLETLKIFAEQTTLNEAYGLCSEYQHIFDTRYEAAEGRSREILWEFDARAEEGYNNSWHREVGHSQTSFDGVDLPGPTGYQNYIPTYALFKKYDTKNDRRYRQSYLFSNSRPAFLKGYDVQASSQTLGGANVVLLRTADAYLMLAEAYNELGAPDNARFFLDLVRERAGLPNIDVSLSQEQLRQAILDERQLEFVGEGAYRLYDLRRTGTYLQVMEAYNDAATALESTTEAFPNPLDMEKNTTLNVPFIRLTKIAQPKHLLLPIPADERIANPNLTQNEGW